MVELTLEKSRSSFQISVGEEGAVVIYSKEGKVQTRLFVRTTEPHDTQKLVQLLSSDHEAYISFYLDTMDQSYVQRTVVGVRAFSVNKIAQTQLDYEVPKNYLKAFISISRSQNKRQDWVYTFVAAAYEQPLYKWIEFIVQYDNIIEGIYFLPVELANTMKALRLEKKIIGWEIIICQNKTGGFRQSIFFNGNIIFSRILKNIYDTDADVMAGNIEQAVANAADHIAQLDINSNGPTTVYIILAQEIIKLIRAERIKANVVEILTPYKAALRLGVAEMAADKDKFFDPVFLAYAASHGERKNRMHVEQTRSIFKWAAIIYLVKRTSQILTPILILLILLNLYHFSIDQFEISAIKNQNTSILKGLAEKKVELEKMENSVQGTLSLSHISELVDLDKFMSRANDSPMTTALKLSEIMPEYIRINTFRWSYFDSTMPRFKASKLNKQIDINMPKDFKVILTLEAVLANTGVTYKELQGRYNSFVSALKNRFPLSMVSIDNLPGTDNIASHNAEIILNIRITFPSPNVIQERSE